jgi:hypothetical protein
VALDFLKNLKMGERVIQEIKKEKCMHKYTNSRSSKSDAASTAGVVTFAVFLGVLPSNFLSKN